MRLLCALIICADCAGCVRYGRISDSGNDLCGFSNLFCDFVWNAWYNRLKLN